jgi:hypothetical protein
MDITQEYQHAVNRHEESLQRLSALLEQYRNGENLSRDGGPEAELDAASERYEETSTELMGIITGHLVISVSNDGVQQDDDAVARAVALKGIDARIVRYTTAITAFRDPEGAGHGLRQGPLTQGELATLGDEGLAGECAPAFGQLRQEDATSTPTLEPDAPAVTPSAFEVKPYFDSILHRAAGDIAGTFAAGGLWKLLINDALCDTIRDFGTSSLTWLKDTLTPLRRLLVRGWRQVLTKISLLVGPQGPGVGELAEGIIKDYIPDAEEWSLGALLGKALKVRDSQSEAQKLVDKNLPRVPRVKEACEKVDAHHADRRKAIRILNLALPGLLLIPGHGLPLQVTATASLLIYEIWLAHDHLDSPILKNLRLPKNTGLLTAVNAALADSH